MEEILRVDNLKKTFKLSRRQQMLEKTSSAIRVAVDGLSFSVNRGEIFGLLGPNGAGKTTTIRMVCGLLRATSGSIKIGNIKGAVGSKEMKRMIGYVPDFFGVYDNLKVNTWICTVRCMACMRGRPRSWQTIC